MTWLKNYIEKQRENKLKRQQFKKEQNKIAIEIIEKTTENFNWKHLSYSNRYEFTYKKIIVNKYVDRNGDDDYEITANGVKIKCDYYIARNFYNYLDGQHTGNEKERIQNALETL